MPIWGGRRSLWHLVRGRGQAHLQEWKTGLAESDNLRIECIGYEYEMICMNMI